MLQIFKNLFKPKSKEIVKTPWQLYLEKYNYNQGQDVLVLPETDMARSDINVKYHSVIYLKYLKSPAIIKS